MPENTVIDAELSLDFLRTLSDEELVRHVRSGHPRAFEPVMRRYNQRLFRAARGITGSDAEAEDVVQDAYVRAYTRINEFRGPKGLGAWLTRIAVNQALMRKRRPDAADPTGPEYDDETPREDAMANDDRSARTPEQEAANDQLGRLLERCVDDLPASYRVAFILREIEQLSVAETAQSLGIPAATVKTRVHRARRLLRDQLSRELAGASGQAYRFAGHRCDRIVETVFLRLAGFAGHFEPDERSH